MTARSKLLSFAFLCVTAADFSLIDNQGRSFAAAGAMFDGDA